jgi:hypothetical protein
MSGLSASSAHFLATPIRPGTRLRLLPEGEFVCVVIAYAAPLLSKSMVRPRPAWSVIVKVADGNVLRR